MTAPRSLALILGLLYTGVGALGLMPGALAGLVPGQPVLGALHLGVGAWGLAAYAGRASMSAYLRGAAFLFAILALGGMLEGVNHGPLVWLHLASAGFAGFVGWRPRSGERRSLAGDRRRRSAAVAAERRNAVSDRRALVTR